ncbi:MAG: hypothetical protein AAB072_08965 [Nitrospirota bacterium]|jgi:hypothetical protein
MSNSLPILLLGLSLTLSMPDTGRAESAQDRVALMLTGPDCLSLRQQIVSALEQQAGVLRADQDLMPDHVLVDIVRPHLTEEELTAIANQAISGGQCRADIMKSCITAGPPVHGIDSPQSVDGPAHSH